MDNNKEIVGYDTTGKVIYRDNVNPIKNELSPFLRWYFVFYNRVIVYHNLRPIIGSRTTIYMRNAIMGY